MALYSKYWYLQYIDVKNASHTWSLRMVVVFSINHQHVYLSKDLNYMRCQIIYFIRLPFFNFWPPIYNIFFYPFKDIKDMIINYFPNNSLVYLNCMVDLLISRTWPLTSKDLVSNVNVWFCVASFFSIPASNFL